MKSIVMMIDDATIGGGQRHILQLLDHLDRQKYHIAMLCGERGFFTQELETRGISYEIIPMSNIPRLRSIARCRSTLRKMAPAIVHTHGGTAGFYGRLATRAIPEIKTVHTYHGIHYAHAEQSLKKKLFARIDRYLASKTDRLICVSHADFEIGVRLKLVHPSRTRVIPNGIDINKFNKRPDQGKIGREEFVIGTVARLHEQKGHRYLIETAKIIHGKHPSVRFHLIGGGELLEPIKTQIADAGLDEVVLLLGERNDIDDLYNTFDAFALPSLWEGLPLVLLEAMAAGLPVVATDISGNAELIDDNVDGLLCASRNSADLARILERIITEKTLRTTLGANARDKIVKNYSVSRTIQEVERLYDEL